MQTLSRSALEAQLRDAVREGRFNAGVTMLSSRAEAGGRSRATLDHIRIIGQLGAVENRDRARRSGARI